jgi:hypothetical protein
MVSLLSRLYPQDEMAAGGVKRRRVLRWPRRPGDDPRREVILEPLDRAS